jgi:hypothetical protein
MGKGENPLKGILNIGGEREELKQDEGKEETPTRGY